MAAGIGGVVAALVLLEILFRIAGVGSVPATKCFVYDPDDRSVEYHCYPSNPGGKFRPLPDLSRGRWQVIRLTSPYERPPLAALDELPWCVEYRREGLGVRGPAPSPRPSPGAIRFAGVGDSFALGEGVPYEETLFVRLAEHLGGGVEVLNGAESGLETKVEIEKLEWMVSRYGCNRGLIVLTLNDVAMTDALRAPTEGAFDLINLRTAQLGPGGTRPWWRRASRVAELVAGMVEVREISQRTVRGYLDAFDPAKNAAGLDELQRRFERLRRPGEVPTGLVIYPMMYELTDYPLQACHDEVVRRARAAHLPVLDLAPAFAGQDARDLQVHPIDHHPNGRAHDIAARAIAEWLRTEPSLRW